MILFHSSNRYYVPPASIRIQGTNKMVDIKFFLTKLFCCLILSFFIGNVVLAENSDTTKTKDNWDVPAVQLGVSGFYRVSIKSNLNPLTVNQFHSWVVHVETPEGKVVEDANIQISGGMPAHKHGFPTSPRVTKYFGNGDYLLEGVKFSMPGPWVMILKVSAAGKRDNVSFDITL